MDKGQNMEELRQAVIFLCDPQLDRGWKLNLPVNYPKWQDSSYINLVNSCDIK